MSMFGWSAGDLLQFAKLVQQGFEYYQSAPQNLRQSLERFQYVADHLEDLSDVLKKSGWPYYDRAPKLEDDLKDAKSFFDRYASLSTATTVSTSRLFDTARLGLGPDKGKLRGIDENLKDHLDKMSAFKQHVILICSLRNLELAQRLQASSPGTATYPSGIRSVGDDRDDDITVVAGRSNTLGSSRLDPDNVSVISNAFSAINLASKLKKSSSIAHINRETRRFQPQLEPVSPTSPVLDALKAASEREFINEFIDEIVGLSEELQLYSQNPSLPQSPQQLAKITSTAMKLCDSIQPQRRGSMTSPRLTLPEVDSPIESFRESIFSTLSSYSNITDTTEWSPNQPNPMRISPGYAGKTTSMPNIDTRPVGGAEPPPREAQKQQNPVLASQSGTYIMDIGPPAKQPLAFSVRLFETSIIGVAAIECTLDFAEAGENSPFCSITAIAVNQRRKSPSSRAERESIALTPQTHLDLPENVSINDVRHATDHRRIFHHKFVPSRRPFPHTLHPDVEGPKNEKDAPYTITFAAPQLFEEEGMASSPTRSTNLKYIFASKEDRDVLQSLIFGKVLIFSAGIKKVTTTEPSRNHSDDQQAVRMWLSKDGKTKSITVYFKDGKPRQKLYKEYQIYGLHPDMLKLKLEQLKPKTPVQVLVVEETRGTTFDSRRRSSTTSAHTFSSRGSTESVNSKPLTCCLHFSEDGDNTKFLKVLAKPFDIHAS